MATFNGELFLEEQIASLASQTLPNIDLWISDDGSQDGTLGILDQTAAEWKKGQVKVLAGPRLGFLENFRSLITDPRIRADYYAFCDQDDVWDADKLAVATEWLSTQPVDLPALYCSRTRLISQNGELTGFSTLFVKEPSFKNAIVQSIAGANTMVMNRAARDIVAKASARTTFVSHDWWCYLLITGVGGSVRYSPDAKIGYRQHSNNLVGENSSTRARVNRLRRLIQGGYREWNRRNLESLNECLDLLTNDAKQTLEYVTNCRTASLWRRMTSFVRSGVHRQTLLDQAALLFACVIKEL
ncbi:glycosyltransferase family 2 protein [Microbulbifer bruguierae]|uniref:Glycosyltransferase family 2 protein n=1 Tax=Microbulbifer bruguierae TaxID=3029061 RepID=A0ABY8NEF0_9GAMM|nr:glycosyltransferase family 2 protein [Microbulbifer bruguierae]WGL17296.1 glycosyltransferase family 2 protein [Microbulbifer bruguierae]